MKPRSIIVIVSAIVAAIAFAATTHTSAGAAGTASTSPTFTLAAPPGGTTTSLDLGKKGISPGDEFVTTNGPLVRVGSSIRVGRIDAIETSMSATRSRLQLSAQLARGTLEVDGVYDPNHPRSALPLVGGTASFAGARGTVVLSTSGHAATLTFHLDR